MAYWYKSTCQNKAAVNVETTSLQLRQTVLQPLQTKMNLSSVNEMSLIHDCVHGPIRMDPLLMAIIDTPQFQRLRSIKQLGTAYSVFPGGCHNRFEHCIGTSYLCGLMLKTLRDHFKADYQDETVITKKDILCVQIAGLLHDLGHGPFSHAFEVFVKHVQPDSTWCHEDASIALFDHLLASNPDVKESFLQSGLTDDDIELIKRMIQGRNPDKDTIPETTIFQGQVYYKWFLYEIVSNKRTGIDCDKFDYLARDSHYVGINNTFNHLRFFKNVRVLGVKNQFQICVRDKEMFNLYELFHVRWMLHHQVYQHKTLKVIDHMIHTALALVDEKFGISKSIHDMRRYTYLTDGLYNEILRSVDNDPGVKKAQEIFYRLQKRKLYKFCGQVTTCLDGENEHDLNEELISDEIVSPFDSLSVDDIYVNITRIGYGMKGKDPLLNLTFFTKSGDKLQLQSKNLSGMFPKMFNEEYIRVYSKDRSKAKMVEEAFATWCQGKGYISPNHFAVIEEQQ